MSISDYSVEGLDQVWDIVDSYFDFTSIKPKPEEQTEPDYDPREEWPEPLNP
jgi:hypothetical protein